MSEYNQESIFDYQPEEETNEINLKNANFMFSYSKMSLYLECPLKYKFRYIDRIPEKPKPFLFFGNTIHKVLEYFYSRIPVPELSELLNHYTRIWNTKNFIEKGYYKSEYEELDYKKGVDIITNFYNKHKDEIKLPFLLEYSTDVNIDGVNVRIIADRIEYLGNGFITIIDYKTGKPADRTSDQLYFYQKVCESDEKILDKIYQKYGDTAKSLKVNEMIYYYVENLKEVKFERASDSEIKKFWEKALKVVEDIHSEKFEPTPSERSCNWCDFKNICPVYKKEQNNTVETETIKEYIKIKTEIENLSNKLEEIEKKILSFMNNKTFLEYRTDNITVKIHKKTKYEILNREKIINILKENNLYDKILRPTLQSIIELMETDIDSKIKFKLKENINTAEYIISEIKKDK